MVKHLYMLQTKVADKSKCFFVIKRLSVFIQFNEKRNEDLNDLQRCDIA